MGCKQQKGLFSFVPSLPKHIFFFTSGLMEDQLSHSQNQIHQLQEDRKRRVEEAKKARDEKAKIARDLTQLQEDLAQLRREIDLLKSEEASLSLFISFAAHYLFVLFYQNDSLSSASFLQAWLPWLFPTLGFGGSLESSVLSSPHQSNFLYIYFFFFNE